MEQSTVVRTAADKPKQTIERAMAELGERAGKSIKRSLDGVAKSMNARIEPLAENSNLSANHIDLSGPIVLPDSSDANSITLEDSQVELAAWLGSIMNHMEDVFCALGEGDWGPGTRKTMVKRVVEEALAMFADNDPELRAESPHLLLKAATRHLARGVVLHARQRHMMEDSARHAVSEAVKQSAG